MTRKLLLAGAALLACASAQAQTNFTGPVYQGGVSAPNALITAGMAAYPFMAPFAAGTFHNPCCATSSNIAPTSGRIAAVPIFIPPGSTTLKSVSVWLQVAPSASWLWEACLYSSISATNPMPGNLVAGSDTTAAQTGTSAGIQTATYGTPVTLTPGWYWAAVGASGTITGTLASVNAAQFIPWTLAGPAASQNGAVYTTVTFGGAGTSNCPSAFGSAYNATTAPNASLGF
jgi:hypothetical protein